MVHMNPNTTTTKVFLIIYWTVYENGAQTSFLEIKSLSKENCDRINMWNKCSQRRSQFGADLYGKSRSAYQKVLFQFC